MASIDYQEARKEIIKMFSQGEASNRKIIFWYDPPANFKDDITDDSIKDEQLASLQKQIANILYATRNNIVHAKSNYTPNGLELQGDELIDGNKMMDIIAMSIIQWNERQPAAYRI